MDDNTRLQLGDYNGMLMYKLPSSREAVTGSMIL